MTKIIGESQTLFGNPSEDAFGRFRVSDIETIFLHTNDVLAKDTRRMIEAITGSATSTHRADESSVRMQCTAASGDKVTRESKWYLPYEPGRSQIVQMTFVMSAPATANEKRVGQFDDNDGVFFEQHASGVRLVRRTSTSGSAVDNEVEQASWDDPLDGTGEYSGTAFDEEKVQLMRIDYGWQGAGSVRVSFFLVDSAGVGGWRLAHTFVSANTLAVPWSKTARLPIRYEIENTAASSGTPYLDEICVAVQSEGGQNGLDIIHSGSTANENGLANPTPVNAGIRAAVFGVRLRSGYERAVLQAVGFSVMTDSGATMLVEVSVGGSLTSPTATSRHEIVEVIDYGTTAIASANISGDTVIFSQLVVSAGATAADLASFIPQEIWVSHSDVSLSTRDSINVVVTPLAAENIHAALTWRERY